MTAITPVPGVARFTGVAWRMARITWFRHRWAVTAILGVFGVAALVLLGEGIAMRAWLDANGIAHCLPMSAGNEDAFCRSGESLVAQFSAGDSGEAAFFAGDTAHLLLAVPAAAALFGGLPWLTREFETGSFRYTWVQGINPRCLFLGQWWLRPRLLSIAPVVSRQPMGSFYPSHWNDLWLNGWITAPDGHSLTAAQELKLYLAISQSRFSGTQGQWLAAHHYVSWAAYQPHSRLVLFQLAMALALLVLSALLVLAAVRLLRARS